MIFLNYNFIFQTRMESWTLIKRFKYQPLHQQLLIIAQIKLLKNIIKTLTRQKIKDEDCTNPSITFNHLHILHNIGEYLWSYGDEILGQNCPEGFQSHTNLSLGVEFLYHGSNLRAFTQGHVLICVYIVL